MPNSLMSAKDIKALALLPSREELLAKLMGTMQAPVAKLVRTHERGAGQVRAHARRLSRLEGERPRPNHQELIQELFGEQTWNVAQNSGSSIGKLTVLELSQLIKDMEEKFGVSAAAAASPWPPRPPAARAAAAEEKTEFTVMLTAVGRQQGERHQGGARSDEPGLKEAKDLVDGAPKPVKEGVSKADAEPC